MVSAVSTNGSPSDLDNTQPQASAINQPTIAPPIEATAIAPAPCHTSPEVSAPVSAIATNTREVTIATPLPIRVSPSRMPRIRGCIPSRPYRAITATGSTADNIAPRVSDQPKSSGVSHHTAKPMMPVVATTPGKTWAKAAKATPLAIMVTANGTCSRRATASATAASVSRVVIPAICCTTAVLAPI